MSMGSMGLTAGAGANLMEGPRTTLTPPSPDFVGPMPETVGPMPPVDKTTGAPAKLEPLKENLSTMQKFTNLLGKDPKEREKNAKIFAALVKDLGNVGAGLAQSTLMQRMMEEQMNSPTYIPGGQASGGVGALPTTFANTSQPIPGGYR